MARRGTPPTGAGTAAAVPGRRERKKQATRAAVRKAALRLALRHGVENVTVERIAAEADIAVRTFFNYFSSKEEAVVAAAAEGAEELVAAFRARPPGESVLWALRQALLEVVVDDAVSRDYVRVMWLITRTPSLLPHQLALLAAQEKALAAAIAERLPPGEDGHGGIYPRLCAATALAALRVVVGRWLRQVTGPDATLSIAALREEMDRALAELAAGLDRPGSA